MALQAIHDSQDDIPEQFRELYSERDGKWELTGIEGVKTQADVDRVQESLTKERTDHKATKTALSAFKDIDIEQVDKDKVELEELRAQVEGGAGDGFDKEKFDEAVEKVVASRVATQIAPVQRDLAKVTEERDAFAAENGEFKVKETTRTIKDAVSKAAIESKVITTAIEDVLTLAPSVFEVQDDGSVLTKDGAGVTAMVSPEVWLSEMQEKRPHWWPAAQGGGANGGNGAGGFANNPFSSEHWNLTQQGVAMRENRTRAEQMATAAGTTIGGAKPAPKPQPAA